MIELFSSTTPNVLKVVLMLEECGLGYALKPVNVWAGEQFAPDFVALNPNAKVPVLVDADGPGGRIVVFESIAILQYLAEKTGRFLPASGQARYDVLQWLVFQAANLGPANGQFNHFERYAPPAAEADEAALAARQERQHRRIRLQIAGQTYREMSVGEDQAAGAAVETKQVGFCAVPLPGIG